MTAQAQRTCTTCSQPYEFTCRGAGVRAQETLTELIGPQEFWRCPRCRGGDATAAGHLKPSPPETRRGLSLDGQNGTGHLSPDSDDEDHWLRNVVV